MSRPKKHGCSGVNRTSEYCIWNSMIQRCTNPRHKNWLRYGGRGITVCNRWLGKNGFENFLLDLGNRPPDHSLDRIDSDGNYEPANCRWSSSKTQAKNKRNSLWLTFNGLTLHVIEWAKRRKIKASTIRRRLKDGWSVERSLTEPTH